MAAAPGGEVIVYEAPDGEVGMDVHLEHETVWLSLSHMTELFGRGKLVISRHLRKISRSGELEREATGAKNATVQREGRREVVREIKFFNLDACHSLGRLSVFPNRDSDRDRARTQAKNRARNRAPAARYLSEPSH